MNRCLGTIFSGWRRPSVVQSLVQKTVFVLGDSISIHYGPYLRKMLQGPFRYDRKREAGQKLEDLDQPIGANGGDSRQVLKFLRRQRKRKVHHDILLLNCGLHDIRTDPRTQEMQVPAEEYRRNLQGILRLTKKTAISTVWVQTTPIDDERHNSRDVGFERYDRDVVHYNGIADEVMRDNQIPIIDLYSFTKNLGNDIYRDHAHFTEEVSALQAAFIAGHLYRLNPEAT